MVWGELKFFEHSNENTRILGEFHYLRTDYDGNLCGLSPGVAHLCLLRRLLRRKESRVGVTAENFRSPMQETRATATMEPSRMEAHAVR